MATNLDNALDLARRGFHVFPVRAGDKAPAIRRDSDHPRECRGECGGYGHGCHDGTRDEDMIRAMWYIAPDAVPAIATGPSGIVVIDVDVKNGQPGAASLTRIIDEALAAGDRLPVAPLTVVTPSGGWHVYFAAGDHGIGISQGADGPDGRAKQGTLGAGIDVRGAGGYVLSPHAPGYRATSEFTVSAARASQLPEHFVRQHKRPEHQRPRTATPAAPSTAPSFLLPSSVERPAPPPELAARLDELCDELALAPEGVGNHTAASVAYRLGQFVGAAQLGADEAMERLEDAVSGWSWRDGASHRALLNTLRRGVEDGQDDPRQWNAAYADETAPAAILPAPVGLPRPVPFSAAPAAPAWVPVGDGDEPEDDDDEPDDDPAGWTPVDVADILAGTYVSPIPTIGRRVDGQALLYPGKDHAVNAEPEAGKTWFTTALVAQVLADGGSVVYVDFEDVPATIVNRALAQGAPATALGDRSRFAYVSPERQVESHPQGYLDLLERIKPTLVVLDGVTEGFSRWGLEIEKSSHSAVWRDVAVKPALAVGASVIQTDHVVKDASGRGRWAIGSGHKMASISGAAFSLISVSPMGRGLKGRSKLVVAKDRPGSLREHAERDEDGRMVLADLVVDGTSGAQMPEVSIYAPIPLTPEGGEGEDGQPAAVRLDRPENALITSILKDSPEGYMSVPALRAEISARQRNNELVGRQALVRGSHVTADTLEALVRAGTLQRRDVPASRGRVVAEYALRGTEGAAEE